MINKRHLSIFILISIFLLESCTPLITPIVKERKSRLVAYKDKRFDSLTKSRVRKLSHKNDHLYYDRKKNLIKEVTYGEPIGGGIFEGDTLVGSWSGTKHKNINEKIHYYYIDNELIKTKVWRYRNNKKFGSADSTIYENVKAIKPDTEIIKNGNWEIRIGSNYTDSIKLDNENRVLLKMHYYENKLSFYEKYEYHGPAQRSTNRSA